MKKLLISIKDLKADSWSFPAQADNRATALRSFADLVNDKRTLVGQHPEDFDLYMVGVFNIESGTIDCVVQNFGNGSEFVHEVRN